jgi:hypothetical protein
MDSSSRSSSSTGGRDGIFAALADSSDCISTASLVKFYSTVGRVDGDPRLMRASPMTGTEALKAINLFKEILHTPVQGYAGNALNGYHETGGNDALDQLQFQRGLDNIINIIDRHDDKQLITTEIESLCARCIDESSQDYDLVALLGLPSEVSSSELKSFLT